MVNLGFIQFEWWWGGLFTLMATIISTLAGWRLATAKSRRELADAEYRLAEARKMSVSAENDSWDGKYKNYVDSLQSQNIAMFQRQDSLMQENAELRDKISELKSENAQFRTEIENANVQISDLKQHVARLEQTTDAYEKQILELREMINSLRLALHEKK